MNSSVAFSFGSTWQGRILHIAERISVISITVYYAVFILSAIPVIGVLGFLFLFIVFDFAPIPVVGVAIVLFSHYVSYKKLGVKPNKGLIALFIFLAVFPLIVTFRMYF